VSCLYILIVCLCIFIVPAGTLRLPRLRFFRAFSSVVRQMPGYNSQRRGTACTLPKILVFYGLFVLCRSVYCLCVNVYCTTAAAWQPNCSLTNISLVRLRMTSMHETDVWSVFFTLFWKQKPILATNVQRCGRLCIRGAPLTVRLCRPW
jgi:hypothetical protein